MTGRRLDLWPGGPRPDLEDATLPLVERFGPTLQGEGPAAGQVAWFIRLGGCNLSCSWCDTPYTWDRSRYDLTQEITTTPVEQILDGMPDNGLVVVTGGEPLIQQDRPGWARLLELATRRGRLHIETNGTLAPNQRTLAAAELIVVSPKLPNAGTHRGGQNPTLHPAWAMEQTRARAHLKIVCDGTTDVERARGLADVYGWPASRVWVMPEGTDPATLAARWPAIATAAAELGINATHRLHVLAWGDKRGH